MKIQKLKIGQYYEYRNIVNENIKIEYVKYGGIRDHGDNIPKMHKFYRITNISNHPDFECADSVVLNKIAKIRNKRFLNFLHLFDQDIL